MLEAQLQTVLISALDTGIAAWNGTAPVTGVASQAQYQPRQSGAPDGPSFMVYHVGSKFMGWPTRKQSVDQTTGIITMSEKQRIESRYQISALAPQSPATPNAPTAADILRVGARIISSYAFIQTITSLGVQALRVGSDLRNLWFEDERDQSENNPSFDIILTHNDIFTDVLPSISEITVTVNPV